MELYERNINSSVRKTGPDTILTEASLLDLNHSMRVSLEINLQTREIVKADAIILKAPLRACDNTVELVKKLVGLKIGRGINRKLIEHLGQSDGCTHLYELALNAVRLSFNVMVGMRFNWKEWIAKSLSDADFVKIAMPYLKNTCRPFKAPPKE
ncbi:MAG: DUF2889 domain-containing protein [Deltaproteobacteria bacterium]|nr:DUF2889 domain-containing protein [Deltaproteobacteria bacterium]